MREQLAVGRGFGQPRPEGILIAGGKYGAVEPRGPKRRLLFGGGIEALGKTIHGRASCSASGATLTAG